MNEHHEGFLKILGELNENENRLKATETYKILDDLSDLFVEKGRGKAYIRVIEVRKEKNLAVTNYKDLIDIYFYENQLLIKNEKGKAIIDLIEFFSAEFEDDALDYLENFAYTNCEEQPYALTILLLLAKVGKRTEKTLENTKTSFNSFDDAVKVFVFNYSSALWPDRTINFASNIRNVHQNNNDVEKKSPDVNNQKKWWEFWK